MFWPFTVQTNWSSQPRISSFFRSLKHFFLTVGQNNCGNKTPFPYHSNSPDIKRYYPLHSKVSDVFDNKCITLCFLISKGLLNKEKYVEAKLWRCLMKRPNFSIDSGEPNKIQFSIISWNYHCIKNLPSFNPKKRTLTLICF